LAVSPEPELTIARDSPAREVSEAGRARVRSELLAETNGPYITSELSYFWPSALSCQFPALQPSKLSLFPTSTQEKSA